MAACFLWFCDLCRLVSRFLGVRRDRWSRDPFSLGVVGVRRRLLEVIGLGWFCLFCYFLRRVRFLGALCRLVGYSGVRVILRLLRLR